MQFLNEDSLVILRLAVVSKFKDSATFNPKCASLSGGGTLEMPGHFCLKKVVSLK